MIHQTVDQYVFPSETVNIFHQQYNMISFNLPTKSSNNS